MVAAPLGSSAAQPVGPSQGKPHHRSYLSSLHIKDFALVAEQRIQLEPGLNVITGAMLAVRQAVQLATGG